jgi:SAM-dependent methyltransferase
MMDWRTFASILLLDGGWNTVVVMVGAAALGLACGAVGATDTIVAIGCSAGGPAALAEIARILRPDGYLISTFPFAYNSRHAIVKARHRPGSQPGRASETDLLTEAEYHGDPVHPERGSLVYQIPGWDILDQARRAGLSDPLIHWIASPSYGIVGQELPAVMVLVARRG